MNSVAILDKKQQLFKEAESIASTCKLEIRKMSADESKRFTEIKEEIKELNNELRAIENSLNDNNKPNLNLNKMEKNFSLIKAIRSVANNKSLDSVESAVVEAGANEMRKAGINYVGLIQLPSTESRAAITVASEGTDVVATDLFDVVKPLQARNVMLQAGAKFVSGLVGDLK